MIDLLSEKYEEQKKLIRQLRAEKRCLELEIKELKMYKKIKDKECVKCVFNFFCENNEDKLKEILNCEVLENA